jgi:hypothetical protein
VKALSIWNYALYFGLAVFFEVIATAPIWGLIGAGPGGGASSFLFLAFLLNLPTVLITWSLEKLTGGNYIIWTLLTQIIFWFCLFAFLGRRKRGKKRFVVK